MQIIFVGGWGFTETHYQPFLSGLKESLGSEWHIQENMSCVSFPCKRESTLPSSFIGIGHSLGVASLLRNHTKNLKALINISGFPCFVKTLEQPYGIAPKILRAMQQKFDTQPKQVLHDFYKNCGVAGTDISLPQHLPELAEGLEMLGDTTFYPAPSCPTLSLHSRHDAIVSVSNAKHFGKDPIVYEGASHALPLTHTARVIEDIVAFLTRHLCP